MIGKAIEWFLSYEHRVTVSPTGPKVSMPYHKYGGDAGYDLYCLRDVGIRGQCVAEIETGLRFSPKERVWFEIKARSSTLQRYGLEVVDAIIDRDYRGDMFVIVRNVSNEGVFLKAGDRIAQVIPHRLIPVKFSVGPLGPSPRGGHGFGSTGR